VGPLLLSATRNLGGKPRVREDSLIGKLFRSQSELKDVSCVAIPKILGGVSQLALSLVLVRFLNPSEFGMFSVCLTSVLLLDAVFGSAIDMAIFRLAPLYQESTPVRARQIEKAGLFLKPLASLVLLVPLVLLLPRVSQVLFQDPAHGMLLLAAYGALVGLLIFRSMQVHFQIQRRYVAYGVSDLIHTAARFGTIGLLLVLGHVTPERILGVYCAAAITVTAVGLVWWARPVWAAPSSLNAARELIGILRWYLPTVVVGSIAGRMDVFFVSSWGGVAEAGIYGVALNFALVPQLLGTYAAAVFSPRILPMWREGKLSEKYLKYQSLLAGIAVVLFLLALLCIGPLGSILLPEAYRRSRTVIVFLLPMGLAALINFPMTIPLLLYTYPKVLLLADLLAIPIAAAAYILAIPGNGATIAAMITSGFALLRLAFYQGLAYRLLRRDPFGTQWSLSGGLSHSTV
jgi:O-antigen/teichoic acid export membrane protein